MFTAMICAGFMHAGPQCADISVNRSGTSLHNRWQREILESEELSGGTCQVQVNLNARQESMFLYEEYVRKQGLKSHPLAALGDLRPLRQELCFTTKDM
jgi:hypothetical protein